jgi:hypothetical protein
MRRAETLSSSSADYLEILGVSISWNPQRLYRLVLGNLNFKESECDGVGCIHVAQCKEK